MSSRSDHASATHMLAMRSHSRNVCMYRFLGTCTRAEAGSIVRRVPSSYVTLSVQTCTTGRASSYSSRACSVTHFDSVSNTDSAGIDTSLISATSYACTCAQHTRAYSSESGARHSQLQLTWRVYDMPQVLHGMRLRSCYRRACSSESFGFIAEHTFDCAASRAIATSGTDAHHRASTQRASASSRTRQRSDTSCV